MGTYDSVMAPCPKCGKEMEFQSKSGPCELKTFSLKDAPEDVLYNVNRHSPAECDCGCLFFVNEETRSSVSEGMAFHDVREMGVEEKTVFYVKTTKGEVTRISNPKRIDVLMDKDGLAVQVITL